MDASNRNGNGEKNMRIRLVVGSLVALVAVAPSRGQTPVGTAFTYQGQLKQEGVVVTDLVDMRFLLFDSDTAEVLIAGPIVFDGQGADPPPLQVSGGLFTAELDFGAEPLQQGGQWLQVEVRVPTDPTDTGPYTPLSPRQKLTAAPFALSVPGLATSEGGVEVAGNVQAAGEVTASAFSSNSPFIIKVNPSQTECARFDDANCYFGLGTAAPQALLHLGGVAGVDGIMFPDGSLQTSAAGIGGGDGFWSPNGANIFNNNGGNVGIGRANPIFKLDVNSSNGFGARLGMQAAGGGALVVASNPGDNRVYLEGYNSTDDGSATEMLITGFAGGVLPQLTISAATVGIGTGTPAAKLDIAASGEGAELLRFTTERPWVFRQVRTGPVTGLQLQSLVGQKLFEITADDGSNVATFVADSGASRVGIGTTAPVSKLDIVGQDGLRITGFQPFLTLADSNNANRRTRIQAVDGNFINFFTEPSFATGIPPFQVRNDGVVVVGQDAVTAVGFQPFMTLSDSSAGFARGRMQNAGGNLHFFTEASFATGVASLSLDHFTTTTHCADFRMGHATRRGSPGRALVDAGDHLIINFARDWGRTFVNGLLQVNALQILGGADLSEQFDVTGHEHGATSPEIQDQNPTPEVQPGMVVCIDAENPGKLVVCGRAYDQTVAGVISGAGGVSVGLTMGQEDSIANGQHPVALTGRVFTLCDAKNGAIRPGDLLTTSDVPGYAMKAVDRDRSHGAIIGKAMTALNAGEQGLVLVLVNLQ